MNQSDSLWFFLHGTPASINQYLVTCVHTCTEGLGVGAPGRVAGHSHIQLVPTHARSFPSVFA